MAHPERENLIRSRNLACLCPLQCAVYPRQKIGRVYGAPLLPCKIFRYFIHIYLFLSYKIRSFYTTACSYLRIFSARNEMTASLRDADAGPLSFFFHTADLPSHILSGIGGIINRPGFHRSNIFSPVLSTKRRTIRLFLAETQTVVCRRKDSALPSTSAI